MKVIIAGSRNYINEDVIYNAIQESKFDITELISGHANGVDKIGEGWAKSHNIPIQLFIPHYSTDNPKIAPLLRNTDMAIVGDALIAIWNDQSRGTLHMINQMKKQKKPIYIVEVNGSSIVKKYFIDYQRGLL